MTLLPAFDRQVPQMRASFDDLYLPTYLEQWLPTLVCTV